MGLKELVGKLNFPWTKAAQPLDEKGRPVPVMGKNVLIVSSNAHDECGEFPHIPLATKQRDPSYDIGI